MAYDYATEQALLNDINRLEIVIDHCNRLIEELQEWLNDEKIWFLHTNITLMIAIVRDGKIDQITAKEQLQKAAAEQKAAKKEVDDRDYERAMQ